MTVGEIAKSCGLPVLAGRESLEREVLSVYSCDLLSLVMGRAPADCAWVTVMGNINSAAVAALADCACVVLAEGVRPDGQLAEKAAEQDIALLGSGEPVFETALKIYRALSGEAS